MSTPAPFNTVGVREELIENANRRVTDNLTAENAEDTHDMVEERVVIRGTSKVVTPRNTEKQNGTTGPPRVDPDRLKGNIAQQCKWRPQSNLARQSEKKDPRTPTSSS